jgi:hypothetical protein
MRQFCASAASEIAQTPIVKAKRNAGFIGTLHKMENPQGGSRQSNKQKTSLQLVPPLKDASQSAAHDS